MLKKEEKSHEKEVDIKSKKRIIKIKKWRNRKIKEQMGTEEKKNYWEKEQNIKKRIIHN